MKHLLVAVAILAAACAGDAEMGATPSPTDTATPPTTSRAATTAPTSTPATTNPPTTTSTPTTTNPPATTTPTSTAPAPPTLFHEGTPMVRFSVAVGDGVDGITQQEFARFVVDTLGDGRSWIGRGAGFELVDDDGEFTIIVALPEDVDRMCAPLETNGRFSCARNGWIAINSLRWFGATDSWPADLDTYRRYVINHEVGHYIVGPGHDSCPAPGVPAPIMMQQTKGLDGCAPNGWVLTDV